MFSITETGVLGDYTYNKTNYMIPRQIRINTSVSNVLQYTLLNFEWLPTDPVKHVKYLGLECLQTHFIKFRRFYMKQNVVQPNSLDFENLNSKLYTLSWRLVTKMICLFSKYFWDEAKCVVEPNFLDFKNLNSKLYTLVFTVLIAF